jgi:hypothetical protein
MKNSKWIMILSWIWMVGGLFVPNPVVSSAGAILLGMSWIAENQEQD